MAMKDKTERKVAEACLTYRGYYAGITYDGNDKIMVGSVLDITDSVNFHGRNMAELTDSFHKAIDNYLDFT